MTLASTVGSSDSESMRFKFALVGELSDFMDGVAGALAAASVESLESSAD